VEEHFRLMLPRGHPLAEPGGPVALADLHDAPWAMGKVGTHYAELTIRACRALGGFEPDIRHRSTDLLILLALVAHGQAVTLLPDLVRAEREPGVVVRDVAEAPLTRTVFSAIRRGSAARPALRALRAALSGVAATA
jgi:DNA-binding transcriptional LysR family regulator